MNQKKLLGVVVGTRGFFNPKLAETTRQVLLAKLDKLGHKCLILPKSATSAGAVETIEDAAKYAKLFRENSDRIQGIIVCLANFGDELGIVNLLKQANLHVPVLIQACDDDIDKVGLLERRDAFCGKLSVCNNLYQYGIPFTDTTEHTCKVESDLFTRDLEFFVKVCRVVCGLRNARIGAIGTRPTAFQTMRFSEKLMQASDITVVPVDLSEIIGAAQRVDANAAGVRKKVKRIREYGRIPISVKEEYIVRSAKLTVTIENWVKQNNIDAAGIQCWTSIQKNYGCATCLTMSMLGESLIPCACEVDLGGVIGMYALTLATGNPSALLDWNNNYGEDRDMCVNTHCSNFPRGFINAPIEISPLSVLGAALGKENCFGGIKGKVGAGPMTYARISTDDTQGRIRAYVGEGEFTDDPFDMDGGIAVCRIPRLRELLRFMCREGFEHHVGMVRGHCAGVIQEALSTYMRWDIYHHK